MEVKKNNIEKLAKAWMAEAKQLRSHVLCDCGCGEQVSISRARFKPGHDAKLLSEYRKKILEILESK